MIDTTAPRFGLPASLWIPIAAVGIADIEKYVGNKLNVLKDPSGKRVNAVLVASSSAGAPREPDAPLWNSRLKAKATDTLRASRQVWVHVDYDGYRQAYAQFGMPAIPQGYFLDHVQNRKAIRLRGNSHPYLRLCPVHRTVNTSGGHSMGGEGMEKRFLANHTPPAMNNRIIYADPMDLTKMLDIPPGTQVLNGVRDTQRLFYP
jgi:hypothetical protein